MTYSTYLGGGLTDCAWAIAVRGREAYVIGYISSFDCPTTPGVFQASKSGDFNAFVTRLNASGSRLVYSSYRGGRDDELSDGSCLLTLRGGPMSLAHGVGRVPAAQGARRLHQNAGNVRHRCPSHRIGSGLLQLRGRRTQRLRTRHRRGSGGGCSRDRALSVLGRLLRQSIPHDVGSVPTRFAGGALDAVVVEISGSPLTSP